MIESAFLEIEFNDKVMRLKLTAFQLQAVCLALGIDNVEDTMYDCYSDEGVAIVIENLKKI